MFLAFLGNMAAEVRPNSLGTLTKHFTKPSEQVAAPPGTYLVVEALYGVLGLRQPGLHLQLGGLQLLCLGQAVLLVLLPPEGDLAEGLVQLPLRVRLGLGTIV